MHAHAEDNSIHLLTQLDGSMLDLTWLNNNPVGDPAFKDSYFYMRGTSAIFSNGSCLAADDPLDASGNPMETLIVATI